MAPKTHQIGKLFTARSLILQRKQFDLLVPGHPGLGMRPTGGLISANMIFHQQQGQLQ